MKFHQPDRCSLFLENLVQDGMWFIFVLFMLSVYRVAFLVDFSAALEPATPWKDIFLTLWFGLRLSLKTAGAFFLPTFVFATLLQTAWTHWPARIVRWFFILLGILIISLLFQARIPYYHEFHNAFSPFVFNTVHDDMWAIVVTSVQQYQAVWRVLAGLICAAMLVELCRQWFKLAPVIFRFVTSYFSPMWIAVLCCVLLVPTAVFVRKGGSFTYNGSIYWKNSARMQQHLLNEAILDDIQALYKASRIHKKLAKSATKVTPEEVRAAAARLMGTSVYQAPDLGPVFSKKASGPIWPKPRHIFVIVAETYMQWPLLDKYIQYPIADGLRRVAAQRDAVLLNHFMPAGNGTMFGLTSVVLGLPELNLVTASRPTAQEPYETALSVQLAKQGYKTRFFYGGFPSWENVGLFMEHQGFEEAFYAADFGAAGGVWGVADKEFLAGVAEKISDEPSLNVILTSSNHPPYKVNMAPETDITPLDELERSLPSTVADKKLTAERMQHFEYADKYLAQFITQMQQKYPDSLFIVTGDHADRWTLENSPSDYERLAVPLLIVGRGITKTMLPKTASGSHMDIVPTVLELVSPRGTPYYALGKSIFKGQDMGLYTYCFLTNKVLGSLDTEKTELLPGTEKEPTAEELAARRQRAKDLQTVAAWRILHGLEL